jgi:3'-phosphoadenosine 5'-phosphosulfate sulfotransferase (PAPS reductase)/FAD synthetase
MLASLIFDVTLSIPAEQRKKPISVLCTDTRVEIPAIADMIEGTLDRMRKCSEQNNLNIDANLLKPLIEESFSVNIIGRGYPPPNRTFRWCTQRMKIDPVNELVKQRVGHWGEAILHLGSRRAESSTRLRNDEVGSRWHVGSFNPRSCSCSDPISPLQPTTFLPHANRHQHPESSPTQPQGRTYSGVTHFQ